MAQKDMLRDANVNMQYERAMRDAQEQAKDRADERTIHHHLGDGYDKINNYL